MQVVLERWQSSVACATFAIVEKTDPPLNDRAFRRPDAWQTARGYDWRDLLKSGGTPGARNGGINGPAAITLQPETVLVRFAESGIVELGVRGGWWLEWDEYRRVEAVAGALGLPISDAVRRTCAVPTEWNAMDLIIQARVLRPLRAYVGPGRDATDANTAPWPAAHGLDDNPIRQTFIPGMGNGDLHGNAIVITGWGHMPSVKAYRTTKRA